MKNGKPYILLCSLHCPVTTSMHYLRNFRKVLGRENVISCGPDRGHISWDLRESPHREFSHDVETPEKPHPHIYTYDEVFDLCRKAGFDVDFDAIIVMEPNFTPKVDTFRPDCPIAYYQCDTHRGPRTAMWAMEQGQVDYFIYPNLYHKELFEHEHIVDKVKYTPKRLIWSPTAADPDLHKRLPEVPEYEKHDIIFLGNDGIDKERGEAHEDFIMADKWALYMWKDTRGNISRQEGPHPLFQVGCATDHRFGEYGPRAEILCRLKRDYKNRFKILPTSPYSLEYVKTLNKGKMVINCSINQDLNMRVTEAMSCGKVLITDDVMGLVSVAGTAGENYVSYKKYFHHLNVNFDLEYDVLANKINRLLSNPDKIKQIQENAYNWIRNNKQTYESRCRDILSSMLSWRGEK